MRYGVRLVISGYRVYYCVVIIADEPTRLQIAYRLRIVIVLMCAIQIIHICLILHYNTPFHANPVRYRRIILSRFLDVPKWKFCQTNSLLFLKGTFLKGISK